MRIFLILFFSILSSCSEESKNSGLNPIIVSIRAADISFLPEIEAYPTTFFNENGGTADVLDILKENGCNTIRIRLWHTPTGEHSSLDQVIDFSERVRAKGLKVWLTVHYSDTWADPGHQEKPLAWSTLGFDDLADSVYNYTKKIATILQPDIIQIGNEINDGFLWPEGKISSSIPNFATLLKEGVQAVRDFSPTTKIMIHYAGHEDAQSFYQQLQNQNVSYDMIGLSYYPIWHGKDLNALKTNMDNLSLTFEKEIVIAETAYPFTLGWDDNTNNIVGLSQHLISGYPATSTGQKKFLLKIKELVSLTENGTGFCYWAPEWVAYKGSPSTSGSPWENMALFNFDNKALPAMKAFE